MRPIGTRSSRNCDGWGLRWWLGGEAEPLAARAQVLAGVAVQGQQPGYERRQVLVRGKVNRFDDWEPVGQHVADDLADEFPQLVVHVTLRRASSAASAAWRTSASEPDRYSRPVAPIIR